MKFYDVVLARTYQGKFELVVLNMKRLAELRSLQSELRESWLNTMNGKLLAKL
jgi:hypothetical protein